MTDQQPFRKPIFRMYVDEVGNADLGSSDNVTHRFLGLTGVIIKMDLVRDSFQPVLESLKRDIFHSHPDEPIILHRKELVNRKYPFRKLQDPEIEKEFNERLLKLIEQTNFSVCSVIIDKKAHKEQYKTWQYDPYHYGLMILIERYTMFLEGRESCGDVMAESRGGREDMRLKKTFLHLVKHGSDYISADRFQKCLTSHEIKMKNKKENIAGLQLADLLAHPAYKAILVKQGMADAQDNFGTHINRILMNTKYLRSKKGEIGGFGQKFLP